MPAIVAHFRAPISTKAIKMGDCCPWESDTAQRYLPKKDNSTLRSLSPSEQREERDRRENMQRRWERKWVTIFTLSARNHIDNELLE